jgi:hypothetical protein
MKFFLCDETPKRPAWGIRKRAHIAREDGSPLPLCAVVINPNKWVLIEELPENTHLCKRCQRLVEHIF